MTRAFLLLLLLSTLEACRDTTNERTAAFKDHPYRCLADYLSRDKSLPTYPSFEEIEAFFQNLEKHSLQNDEATDLIAAKKKSDYRNKAFNLFNLPPGFSYIKRIAPYLVSKKAKEIIKYIENAVIPISFVHAMRHACVTTNDKEMCAMVEERISQLFSGQTYESMQELIVKHLKKPNTVKSIEFFARYPLAYYYYVEETMVTRILANDDRAAALVELAPVSMVVIKRVDNAYGCEEPLFSNKTALAEKLTKTFFQLPKDCFFNDKSKHDKVPVVNEYYAHYQRMLLLHHMLLDLVNVVPENFKQTGRAYARYFTALSRLTDIIGKVPDIFCTLLGSDYVFNNTLYSPSLNAETDPFLEKWNTAYDAKCSSAVRTNYMRQYIDKSTDYHLIRSKKVYSESDKKMRPLPSKAMQSCFAPELPEELVKEDAKWNKSIHMDNQSLNIRDKLSQYSVEQRKIKPHCDVFFTLPVESIFNPDITPVEAFKALLVYSHSHLKALAMTVDAKSAPEVFLTSRAKVFLDTLSTDEMAELFLQSKYMHTIFRDTYEHLRAGDLLGYVQRAMKMRGGRKSPYPELHVALFQALKNHPKPAMRSSIRPKILTATSIMEACYYSYIRLWLPQGLKITIKSFDYSIPFYESLAKERLCEKVNFSGSELEYLGDDLSQSFSDKYSYSNLSGLMKRPLGNDSQHSIRQQKSEHSDSSTLQKTILPPINNNNIAKEKIIPKKTINNFTPSLGMRLAMETEFNQEMKFRDSEHDTDATSPGMSKYTNNAIKHLGGIKKSDYLSSENMDTWNGRRFRQKEQSSRYTFE